MSSPRCVLPLAKSLLTSKLNQMFSSTDKSWGRRAGKDSLGRLGMAVKHVPRCYLSQDTTGNNNNNNNNKPVQGGTDEPISHQSEDNKKVNMMRDPPRNTGTEQGIKASRLVERQASEKKDPNNLPNPENMDVFGLNYDDLGREHGHVGSPSDLPPKYKRDVVTGRFTGEIELELTEAQQRWLQADPDEKDRYLLRQYEQHLERQKAEGGADPGVVMDRLGRRVREINMSTTVLGRTVPAQAAQEKLDDGRELGRDETGFSQHLTPSELDNFAKYMKQQHDIQVTDEDLTTLNVEKKKGKTRRPSHPAREEEDEDPDSLELSQKWLTARAQRQMDDNLDDNPYSDFMPGDLKPSKLVNRQRAKQIPVHLLHHNNVALLQQFLSPTGQILNRIQSRLGARDQRRIARLIKRARNLGLIPYMGQFKVEQHGWIHSPDITEDRAWEVELKNRGLVVQRKLDDSKEE